MSSLCDKINYFFTYKGFGVQEPISWNLKSFYETIFI